MTTINRDEWLAAVEAAGMPTESDDAAMTILEFAEMMDVSRITAEHRLWRMVDLGLAAPTFKRSRRADSKVQMLRAFRLTAPKKKR